MSFLILKNPFCHGLFASHRLVTLIVYQILNDLTSLLDDFLTFLHFLLIFDKLSPLHLWNKHWHRWQVDGRRRCVAWQFH